jgi:hypothetical protein
MKPVRTITAASLLALAAMLALPVGAQASCRPAVTSDFDLNTCIGTNALLSNTTGSSNTASGAYALLSNTTGRYNTGSGAYALYSNTTGDSNTASSAYALYYNTTGVSNTASGTSALPFNTTGGYNTASGASALYYNTTGNNNTASGVSALLSNTTGNNNIALGYEAGRNLTTGSNNIAIGNAGLAGESNTIRIGSTQTAVFFSGIYNTKVTKTRTVLINALGQLGTSKSSIRYKEDVHSMGDASNPLMNLRPVTFRYKEAEPDGSKPIQYGLIAEEVEKVMPDLVIYNDQGTPESVAYETLPSLLLNEYQKQGRKLATAEADLAEEKAKSAASEARLQTVEAELAALKLAVSRLAAAPSSVKLAATAP